MTTLSRESRKALENVVLAARAEAEAGARKALTQLAVAQREPWPTMTEAQLSLRRRLRARGRQLGDRLEEDATQALGHLVAECAYEHWHRMLFARFLAECELLIEPSSQVSISVAECKDLARDRGVDWIELAANFAQSMLPQIFRPDDALLEVTLPAEHRQPLEQLLLSVPSEAFVAEDSLGWVYQFWQSEEKDRVNRTEAKISEDDIPAVTQLFTEDYMVEFLLHNTLGAWWAGRRFPEGIDADSERDARRAIVLPGVELRYLRLVDRGGGCWAPAAGTFDRWPSSARDIRLLDPCMGSAHFLVFALPILVAMRIMEEHCSATEACFSVLRDNLAGLEIDSRCAQIGAFSLALAAWKLGGVQKLPRLSVACSGLKPNAKSEQWTRLANEDDKAKRGMEQLYDLFAEAPTLGSLINPRTMSGSLVAAGFEELQPLLEKALAREQADETLHELAVAAEGIARAAQLLASDFTLVVTNVPYLGREGHNDVLVAFGDRHPDAASDLSTLMLDRCLGFVPRAGSVAVVMPQNWWVGKSYCDFRKRVLSTTTWRLAAVLGEEAWQTFGNRGPNTTLTIFDTVPATAGHGFFAIDVSTKPGMPVVGIETKARALSAANDTDELRKLSELMEIDQGQLTSTRDARITVARLGNAAPLSRFVVAGEGCSTGDNDRFLRGFWEVIPSPDWLRYCGPGFCEWEYCDTSLVVLWENGRGELARSDQARIQNTGLWRVPGVLVGRVRGITATLFAGGCFSKGAVLVSPRDENDLPAVFAFLRSKGYERLVRTIDPRVSAATSVLTSVPFDLAFWRDEAAKEFPNGLPKASSSNPTQAQFLGHPRGAEHPLHVAVLRLVGYRWPAQLDGTPPGRAASVIDEIQPFADKDGIVCLSSIRGEDSAGQRLGAILAASYGAEWSAQRLGELLAQVGYAGRTLDDWLRNGLFEQHCALFGQRPLLWHVWDGRDDGFSALVNYQMLTKTALEKLTYAYLGDWVQRQEAAIRAEDAGSEARLVAAKHLQGELKKILDGEPPYDIFVRWKMLVQQPIGWEPDLNDGVRINIRPFMVADDVGRKGAGILRCRPNIKWDKHRGKESFRERDDFPWFWGWDGKTVDFAGRTTFDGNRWNDMHYSREFKMAARLRKGLA